MVRFPGCLLVSDRRVIEPMEIGKKVIKCAVPEMRGPSGMGKIFILVIVKIFKRNSWLVKGVQRIEQMDRRIIVAPFHMKRLNTCHVEVLARTLIDHAIIHCIRSGRYSVKVAPRNEPSAEVINPFELTLQTYHLPLPGLIRGKGRSM